MSGVVPPPAPPDRARARIAWGLAAVALLSFAGGIALFVPAEHRAQKLAEASRPYRAKHRLAPEPHRKSREAARATSEGRSRANGSD